MIGVQIRSIISSSWRVLTSTVKFECGLEGDALFWGSCFGICGLGSIEGVHISLMVLGVVEAHDLLRDIGLEGIVEIRELGEGMCHDGSSR